VEVRSENSPSPSRRGQSSATIRKASTWSNRFELQFVSLIIQSRYRLVSGTLSRRNPLDDHRTKTPPL
jgi:hypothetical protein